jgi:small-conductance mechanosensitive channel
MFDFSQLSSVPLFTNSWLDWVIAAAVATAILLALLTLRRLVRNYHTRLLNTPKTELLEVPMEVLSHTTFLFFLVVAVYCGIRTLTAGPKTIGILNSVITITLFWQAGVWAVAAARGYLDRKRRVSMQTDRAAAGSLSIISFIITVAIWALVLMLTLENLGVDITALVASLGIGGIAVALAVQNVLGDLFASLSITLDRPFVLGDFLIVDDFLGSVEYIGIKSTRLRSLGGEQIIMSNSDLLKSRVRNYGRMLERRVVFSISAARDTPVEVIERIPGVIREIVEAQKDTRFDRSHFQKYGESSLDFETVYYVLSGDYNKYMDIQQAINLAIHRAFAELGAEFAYPTQKLLITNLTPPDAGGAQRAA